MAHKYSIKVNGSVKEEARLSESEFKVPSDYKKVSLLEIDLE